MIRENPHRTDVYSVVVLILQTVKRCGKQSYLFTERTTAVAHSTIGEQAAAVCSSNKCIRDFCLEPVTSNPSPP